MANRKRVVKSCTGFNSFCTGQNRSWQQVRYNTLYIVDQIERLIFDQVMQLLQYGFHVSYWCYMSCNQGCSVLMLHYIYIIYTLYIASFHAMIYKIFASKWYGDPIDLAAVNMFLVIEICGITHDLIDTLCDRIHVSRGSNN